MTDQPQSRYSVTPKGAKRVQKAGAKKLIITFDSNASRDAFFEEAFPEDGEAPRSERGRIPPDDLFPLLWHLNDHLKITPDQGVEYTGSTNDVDSLRDALHRLDPEFKRGVKA